MQLLWSHHRHWMYCNYLQIQHGACDTVSVISGVWYIRRMCDQDQESVLKTSNWEIFTSVFQV